MAAPHTGGPQLIATDGERGGGGECGRNKLRPSRRTDSPHGRFEFPTRRVASPYTEGLGFLHGETVFSVRYFTNK